jgi:acetyl esterase/lipase
MPGTYRRPSTVMKAVALAACFSLCAVGTVGATPDDAASSLHPCASARTGPPPAAPSSFPVARSVAPSDLGTSVLQKVDGDPQIQCGRVELTTRTDIVYSSPGSAALTLDLQIPPTPALKPLVVYVPVGGFMQADKGGALGLRTYVAEAGYAVASIRYRTVADGAHYTDGVADVKSAVRFLRAHAAKYGIDPTRVALWGESAGGYLAAMTALTNGLPEFDIGDNLDQSSTVGAVIDKFGPSDMARIGADFDDETAAALTSPSFVSTRYFTGAPPGAADPLSYVQADAPPFLFMHGTDDRIVSPSQTLLLHNALRAAGANSTRYVIDGAGHGDLAAVGDNAKSAHLWSTTTVMQDLVGFLARAFG